SSPNSRFSSPINSRTSNRTNSRTSNRTNSRTSNRTSNPCKRGLIWAFTLLPVWFTSSSVCS
ncbi:MAG: hypothetical protein II539_08150, partial [Muribaculaceae bacterium]|nr:hypothetical protein [Muribaculaceae bacterium]